MWTSAGSEESPRLLQQDHDRGHMDERAEVPGRPLIPGGHPAVLLRLEPEPLLWGPVTVAIPAIVPLLRPILQAGDLRLRPTGLDRLDHRPAVIPLVSNDDLDRRPTAQRIACVTSAAWPGFRISLAGSPSPLTAPWI